VKDRQASATALLIAASLVLMDKNPAYAGAVSTVSAELSARVLASYSPASRCFLKLLGRSWFWRITDLLERLTIPGILRHYALRKKCIAQVAREAIGDGISQIVIVGAGFDALVIDLHRTFTDVRFWEIDHPATQRCKQSVLNSADVPAIHFIATDLSLAGLNGESLKAAGFDPGQKTLWLAEGLLMYFSERAVLRLLDEVREISGLGSRMIFTFMERDAKSRIRFRKQRRLVEWWLRRRGEPFRWGIETQKLAEFMSPWRVVRVYDDRDLRKLDPADGKRALAAGELICLAEF
jgi:methyltransferase (TIGR00027 family)